MKNRIILMAAAIAAMAVSCQKVELSAPVVKTEPMVITAGAETKTVLAGTDVLWTKGDAIMVFDNKGGKNEFTDPALPESAATANFAGVVTDETTSFIAVYPSSSVADGASYSNLVVTIPTNQTPKSGSFAKDHNISVASGSKTPGTASVGNVKFVNVCGLLKFTVPSYVGNVSSVTVSTPKEQALAGNATITYQNGSPVLSIAEGGEKAISMSGSFPAGSTFWFVVAPQTLEGLIVTVKAGDDTYGYNTYVMSTTDGIEIKSGHYKNIGVLKLGTTAFAEHTYEDGILTGTEVSVNNIKTDNSGIASYTITNSAGTPVRNSENTITSWPYLPQGTYTVTGLDTNGNSIDPVMFEVPAPEFTVTTPDAYTTYDVAYNGKGKETGTAAANKLNAETIYGLNSNPSVSISPDILKNSNYSKILGSFVTKVDDTTITAGTETKAGLAWGSHTISTSYTFDGVTKTGTKGVVITGLPYRATPPTESGWEKSGDQRSEVEWTSTYVKLEGLAGISAVSMKSGFEIPDEVTIYTTVNVGFQLLSKYYYFWYKPTLICYCGNQELFRQEGISRELTWLEKLNPTGMITAQETYNISKAASFTANANLIKLENSTGTTGPNAAISRVEVLYATK